eukprot:gnl/TRDRNA2_/TRDRNA2_82166_c0_seq1.p1 gnl/TRDRNA2_/TRDRNA2_82166_c0~~gnl/TRDRNA2_/TRDRNA2_82166_c0_seq1.p1  ORF type:complete len:233 (-),score=43.23 gnl/TRDRNA2_/TRDRNA2_82166_c0_seq1:145-843(-)
MDMVGYSITMVCVLSERRMNRLNNSALSAGLPPFLSTNPGMMSGLMLSQYTADTQIVDQRILSAPASIQSIPAAADQEDFVSMGMNTALKNRKILDNAYGVIGIEMMAAAQALDLREKDDKGAYPFSRGVQVAREEIRKVVKFLDIDRPLYEDHNNMKELVKSVSVLKAVEKEVGPLPAPRGGLQVQHGCQKVAPEPLAGSERERSRSPRRLSVGSSRSDGEKSRSDGENGC